MRVHMNVIICPHEIFTAASHWNVVHFFPTRIVFHNNNNNDDDIIVSIFISIGFDGLNWNTNHLFN